MKKSLLRRFSNRTLHLMARFLPGSTNVRPFLHRLRGVRIQGKVFIGDDVYLENEYPECIEMRDGSAIGLRSTIVAHTKGSGRVIIEKNAVIMTACTVVCPIGRTLTIGEGSVIAAGSVVLNSIPAHTLCTGPRIKVVANVTVPFTSQNSYDDFVRGLQPLRPTDQKRE